MLRGYASKPSYDDFIEFAFPVRNGNADETLVTLRADSGPADNWEAVLSVMLPHEY